MFRIFTYLTTVKQLYIKSKRFNTQIKTVDLKVKRPKKSLNLPVITSIDRSTEENKPKTFFAYILNTKTNGYKQIKSPKHM